MPVGHAVQSPTADSEPRKQSFSAKATCKKFVETQEGKAIEWRLLSCFSVPDARTRGQLRETCAFELSPFQSCALAPY